MSIEAKKAAVKLRQEVVQAGLWPCCLNCDYWIERTIINCDTQSREVQMICNKYNMTPPAETIVVGCPHHLQTIPF